MLYHSCLLINVKQKVKHGQQHGRAELSVDYCVSNTATQVQFFDFESPAARVCVEAGGLPASTHTLVVGDSKSASSLPSHPHLSVLIPFVEL